jgi:fermentation-respiration switch protein FrsA (DUF1100 family)
MRRRPRFLAALTILLTAVLGSGLLAGCGVPKSRQALAAEASTTSAPVTILARPTPSSPLAVGVRTLSMSRNGRDLDVTIWYPASGKAGGDPATGAAPASGRYPIVVFSHGLNAKPTDYRALLSGWAAAGFVVAAPAFPHTSRGASQFNLLDVINQPADVSYVLTQVIALDSGGDPLAGHLDTTRVAAAGHSAGGITTVGLFARYRDSRLVAGIVLAGNDLGVGTAFAGPAASLLFVHGNDDPLVPYSSGRSTYDKVPWAKAFLTVDGGDHTKPYLNEYTNAFTTVAATTTDFLRWSLYRDAKAKARLDADARVTGDGTLDESSL